MKRPVPVLLLLALVLVLAAIVLIDRENGRLNLYFPAPENGPVPTIEIENPDILTVESVQHMRIGGEPVVRVGLRGEGTGATTVAVEDQDGTRRLYEFETGGRRHTVYDLSSMNFSGSRSVVSVSAAFLIAATVLLWSHFFYRVKHAFFSCRTVLVAGVSIFAAGFTILFLMAAVRYVSRADRQLNELWSLLCTSGIRFIYWTGPLMILMGLALAISNVALVRHEGLSVKNLLGVLTMILIVLGITLAVAIDDSFFSGSLEQFRLHTCLTSIYATCFVYLEAMLLGTIVCGFIAAVKEPAYDKDFVIINGCQIGKDGKPLPLLRGRVDRALAFCRKQQEMTGKQAVLVPSGGQGSNEPRAEAEAMQAYLLEQGVPVFSILPECRSRNTLENMTFSKELIDAVSPGAKVAFATTNYHVFRSGILAAEAGLDAEGMGSRTRWYFWPNAFIREFVSMLAQEWKLLVPTLLVLIAFFASIALSIY